LGKPVPLPFVFNKGKIVTAGIFLWNGIHVLFIELV
jgi:hypothetical protein